MSLEEGTKTIQNYLKTLTSSAGVYKMYSSSDELLYIGKARNLKNRVKSYTNTSNLAYRIKHMVSLIARMEFITTTSEAEALLLEANLIKKEQPKFNILLKDGKSFPYIYLTGDKDFNMLSKHRGSRKAKGEYFGPFASAGAVDKTLHVMQRMFPLRTCPDSVFNNRERPCLEYQIKRCSGPCVGKINKIDYNKIVTDARDFLKGKTNSIQKRYADKMQAASDAMDYERAATYRDKIESLSKIQARNLVSNHSLQDSDIIVLYRESEMVCIQLAIYRNGQNYGSQSYFPRINKEDTDSNILESFIGQFYQNNTPPKQILINQKINANLLQQALQISFDKKVGFSQPQRGEKQKIIKMMLSQAKLAMDSKLAENKTQAKLLKEMAVQFNLPKTPERIEVYDNSHIQGKHQIGAMVVVDKEGFIKNQYRKFNMPYVKASDDYAMMAEMLTRRFKRLTADENAIRPDVVLIDGGKGQLSAANQVIQDLGIYDVTLIAIAKGEDRNAGTEDYFMVGEEKQSLSKTPLAYFLQRIRDEAHRFAITSHRAQRSKKTFTSALESIAGIGANKKAALLKHFGSVEVIKNASMDDLAKTDGISNHLAQTIYDYFH